MKSIKQMIVFYEERPVGRLAAGPKGRIAFEYEKDWLTDGFSISPFSLPLKEGVFLAKEDPFEGLYGVFADSLPDGWGRLLVDRFMRKNHLDPETAGALTRLALVGKNGMGALTYRPKFTPEEKEEMLPYDEIAEECGKILREESSDKLDLLFEKGGSSGGARPKILTRLNDEDWIIKFPSSMDRKDIGEQEYRYVLCARKCGIDVPEVRLFESGLCSGYFGARRFDRTRLQGKEKRVHMASVSGLLETSHRVPNLDYDLLMRLTLGLTKQMEECEKLFRLMCFNVFAHNRDDHSKNFSFLYREEERRWVLSPAYDLTFSNSLGGEHATSVHGEGRNPDVSDLLEVARGIGLNANWAKRTAEEIRDTVTESLMRYLR